MTSFQIRLHHFNLGKEAPPLLIPALGRGPPEGAWRGIQLTSRRRNRLLGRHNRGGRLAAERWKSEVSTPLLCPGQGGGAFVLVRLSSQSFHFLVDSHLFSSRALKSLTPW